ncbi:DinB family protein [Ferruginibacter paludis]|uniref:DinB family protein n=1 Tax=Ferruginibacter paludis TaxID=1310417 RepID=UPI0025B43E7B|nr:DinB family protein [Ferruginibacter paludis]MDN3657084.1 DinB family protein [Ferruginibacter paludis]
MFKPSPENYPPYFQKYIDQVPDESLLQGFANQGPVIASLLSRITEEKSMHAYAPGKWTLKDLLQHIIDTERIFCFRALCFARREASNIAGFDENAYAASVVANDRTWLSLTEEFLAVRKATELLYKSFTEETLTRIGSANSIPTSVASMGYITLGHVYHHKKIIEERYL